MFLVSAVKRTAIVANIDTGVTTILVGFAFDSANCIAGMRNHQLYSVSVRETSALYPSTFENLPTHYNLNKQFARPLPLSDITADLNLKIRSRMETYFDRISDLDLTGINQLVSFRGVVLDSVSCTMAQSVGVRSTIADESGKSIIFFRFGGIPLHVGKFMYCRLAKVYTDAVDRHIELSCNAKTYVASNILLIHAPIALQNFYANNDMRHIATHCNRSTATALEETTMRALMMKLDVMQEQDIKEKQDKKALEPSDGIAAAASSSSSNASASGYAVYDAYSIAPEEVVRPHVAHGYVALQVKRFDNPVLFYNACTQAMTTGKLSTRSCNKAVVSIQGDLVDHKSGRAEDQRVHPRPTCTQRFMFNVVFEEPVQGDVKETNNRENDRQVTPYPNEFVYTASDEFGAQFIGCTAVEYAKLSPSTMDDIRQQVMKPATYAVTINRNGKILQMQMTETANNDD